MFSRKKFVQGFPQYFMYTCFQVKIKIFVISVPQNAVKKLSKCIKSPMEEISYGTVYFDYSHEILLVSVLSNIKIGCKKFYPV